ncbi:extracellular solute-binding protein [Streptosporangium carneum]|uniref:ABC transporter substrate-binding protein n=1 Tax=Streptosporangium carneum TaxID=47481 RepID=A0A9W6IA23_9ACTN|nr:extracellular solute-binding protein [Streptosporangium carneum]GLK14865.1 ABC transporter substrate-binding protein [Streptosporangium carneum]
MNGELSRRSLLAGAGVLAGAALGVGGRLWQDRRRYGELPPHNGLVLLSGEELSRGEQRRKLVGEWNSDEKHPHVTLIELEGSTDLRRSEIVAAAQMGGHRYDVVNVDVAWMAELIDRGYLAEFPSLDTRDFYGSALKTVSAGGKRYGVPFASDAPLLYYDKRIASEPPRTFMDAVDLGRRLKKDLGEEEQVYAYAGQFMDYEGLTVNAMEIILSNGGDYLEFDGLAVEALRHLVGCLRDRSVVGEEEKNSLRLFREGRAVFLRSWSYAFHQLVDVPPFKDDNERLGVVALPWPGVLGGHNLAVTTTSALRREASDFIVEMTAPGSVQRTFGCGGYASPRPSSYSDPKCPGIDEGASVASETEEERTPDLKEFAANVHLSLTRTETRPLTSWYPDYSLVLRRHLMRARAGDGEIDDRELREEVRRIRGVP